MMAAPAVVEQPTKAPPWDARCEACGGWIATVSGGASWVRVKCMNWRVNRTLSENRRCPKYGQTQTIHIR